MTPPEDKGRPLRIPWTGERMSSASPLAITFLIFEALCVLPSLCIVVPPTNPITLVASVASIELSPYLFAFGGIALIIASRFRNDIRVAAVSIAVLNTGLCSIPIIRTIHAETRWGFATPQVAPKNMVVFQIPVKLGTEQRSIQAYLPRDGTKNPVVFDIYGGAWEWGTPANDAVLDRTLASQGYAVFALDYRHAPVYRFPAQLEDVRQQVALIVKDAKFYRADDHRMAIVGHSSGGQLAELSAFASKAPFRALVSYSGAVDLVLGYEYPPSPDPIGVRSIIKAYMGEIPGNAPLAYRAASPITNVRCGSPPTLLIYGDRDHVVDFRSATGLRDALRACGNDVTLLELPWTEHGFEDVPWGLHAPIALAAVEAFLKRTL